MRAVLALGCFATVGSAFRASLRAVSTPAALAERLQDAEEQWMDSELHALNSTEQDAATMIDVARTSCANVSAALVESVKGHKNGLSKRMTGICKAKGFQAEGKTQICAEFSAGLVEALSDDPKANVAGQIDGSIGAFCGHFFEDTVRPEAEKVIAEKDRKASMHKAAKERIANTLRVLVDAQKEVAQQNQKSKDDDEHEQEAPAKEKVRVKPEESKADDKAAKQDAQKIAEKEGGAQGLAKELSKEEESESDARSQVIKDALAVDSNRDEPVPELKK